MRGDNGIGILVLGLVVGSPPHAWGQCRLIEYINKNDTVHPHMRGDNLIMPCMIKATNGSPPHAWGQ